MQDRETERLERLSANVAKLLSQLLKQSLALEKRSQALRRRINVDLRALAKALPPKDRRRLSPLVAERVQEIFDAAGSPKVETSEGCVGRRGGGVRVSSNGNYAGACAIAGGGGGIVGGGVEVGFSY
jgi:hypothetical protein